MRLPSRESLKAFENYPLALAFHPTLPLLYVWQDIAGPDIGRHAWFHGLVTTFVAGDREAPIGDE